MMMTQHTQRAQQVHVHSMPNRQVSNTRRKSSSPRQRYIKHWEEPNTKRKHLQGTSDTKMSSKLIRCESTKAKSQLLWNQCKSTYVGLRTLTQKCLLGILYIHIQRKRRRKMATYTGIL